MSTTAAVVFFVVALLVAVATVLCSKTTGLRGYPSNVRRWHVTPISTRYRR